MPAAPKPALRRDAKIKRKRDFENIFRSKRRLDTKDFLIFYCTNSCGFDRIGLSASRKIGSAVQRNRAKRILREIFAESQSTQAPWIDVVVSPRATVLKKDFRDLFRGWVDAITKIKTRLRN